MKDVAIDMPGSRKEVGKESFGQGQIYVYRGVHGSHPALSDARAGMVYAANPSGALDPGVHYAGGRSGESQFTSWSFEYEVALIFAQSSVPPWPAGVVLRLPLTEPGPEDQWSWVQSPGENRDEREILLRGRRMDAEVIYDGSEIVDP